MRALTTLGKVVVVMLVIFLWGPLIYITIPGFRYIFGVLLDSWISIANSLGIAL